MKEKGIQVDFEVFASEKFFEVSGLEVWVGLTTIHQIRKCKRRIKFGKGKRNCLVPEAFPRQSHLADGILASSWPLLSPECSPQGFSLELLVQFGFHTLLGGPGPLWAY